MRRQGVGQGVTAAAYALCLLLGAWGAISGHVALLLGGLVALAIVAQAIEGY